MSEYDSLIDLAKRLIKKKGQAVIWRQVSAKASVEQPWKTASSTSKDLKPYVCFVSTADKEWRKILAYLKGSEVPTGRLAGLMGAQAFSPTLKDTIIRKFNGVDKTLTLINADVVGPAEEPVLWILEFVEA